MKKYLFFAILILSGTRYVVGQASVYHAFPDSNAFWGDDGVRNDKDGRDNRRYGLKGDTIIGGLKYAKVFSLFDSTLNSPYSTSYAAIRENNKKIYTVIGTNAECLLYDFGTTVGDTIHYTYSLFEGVTSFSRVVTAIDSVKLVNGKYRKRFILAGVSYNSLPDTLIEGIGSVYQTGLFNPLVNEQCTCLPFFNYTFSCFKQSDTVLYLNNPECERCFCSFLTSVSDPSRSIGLRISPNPFNIETSITFDKTPVNATLTFCNALGQQLLQLPLNTDHITFERGQLATGMYFVNIAQNGINMAHEKLLITDR